MTTLYKKCLDFYKLATNNTQLVSQFKAQLLRAANLLSSKFQAQKIFNHIKSIKDSKEPNVSIKLQSDPWYRELEKTLIQIEYFEEKIPNAASVLGIKSNAIPIIKNNLKILMEGKDFSQYQHYTLLMRGQSKVIDLDELESKKDLGF